MMIRCQIQGLLNIKNQRGLQGDAALWQWTAEALELLLRAELARLEKEKHDEARG